MIIKKTDSIILFLPACFYFILIRDIYFIFVVKIYLCNDIRICTRINIFCHFSVVIYNLCPAADKDISLFHFHVCCHKWCSGSRYHGCDHAVFFCDNVVGRIILRRVFFLRQQVLLKFDGHFCAIYLHRSPDNLTVGRAQLFFEFLTVNASFRHTESRIFPL